MTKDIVVTIIHRDSTGHEDMVRLRSRENRPTPGMETSFSDDMPQDAKRRVLDHVMASDTEGGLRSRLKDITNPDVCQQAGNVIIRPLQARARKIPTGFPVLSLPDGLGDAVPPLRFLRDAHLSLDAVSEGLVCFGMKRSEAQFLVLYVSDIVDEAEASGAAKSVSISLDSMSVVARVERAPAKDATPHQLRVLIVTASHGAPARK